MMAMIKKIFSYALFVTGISCSLFGCLFIFLNKIGNLIPDGYPNTPESTISGLLVTSIVSLVIGVLVISLGTRTRRKKKPIKIRYRTVKKQSLG